MHIDAVPTPARPAYGELNLPRIESPFAEELLLGAGLDASTLAVGRALHRSGFAIIETGVAESTLDLLRECLEAHPALGKRYRRDSRIQDLWRARDTQLSSAVRAIAGAPRVLALLEALYGREPVPFQTLNFRQGTEQPTHSDTIHFHSVPARFMCGVWVALEDIHIEAGPLHYVEGSHTLPIYDLHDLGIRASGRDETYGEAYARYEVFIADLIRSKGLRRTPFCARKGQALLWTANLLHGGDPILDPSRTRHSLVTHYFFQDCINYTPLCSDLFLGDVSLRRAVNLLTGAPARVGYLGQPMRGPK